MGKMNVKFSNFKAKIPIVYSQNLIYVGKFKLSHLLHCLIKMHPGFAAGLPGAARSLQS